MSQQLPEQRVVKRRSTLLSNVLAVAAVVFAIIALFLYLRPGGSGIAPVPTAAPGSNQFVNVTHALQAQGLAVEQPAGSFIPVGALNAPGQGVTVNGVPGFIFLFPDAQSARADVDGLDANAVVPARIRGTPTPAGERRAVRGSNVVLILIGGDDETWQKVEAAVASLP